MNKTNAAIVRTLLLGTSCLSAFAVDAARAQPAGGNVALGTATITNHGGNSTIIDQKTGKLVINWDSFNIAAGGSVQFKQPSSSAIALNRILGADPTSIYGNLLANGQVWIINGNGVMFGQGSRINVGGLIATTSDLKDADFAAGNYSFSGGTGASVTNNGTIRAGRNGYAVLSGASASNHGLIAADTGTVVIGGASAFTVDFQGDGLLRYAVTTPALTATDGHTGASNSGTISAGRVVMTARAAADVQDAVVNNTGMISASSARVQNGEVIFDGGDGDVSIGGTVTATGTATGTTGGDVTVTGRNITVADGTRIDVSGDAGGGTVKIGGDLHGAGPTPNAASVTVGNATIKADATRTGNGGTVVAWSSGTTNFAGVVSAKGGSAGGNGGLVETSGHTLHLASTASVDTRAPKGATGNWLLDPSSIIIASTCDGCDPNATLVTPATITGSLATTDVTLEATDGIDVVDPVIYSSTHAFSLLSQGDINVLASVQNTLAIGGGAINVIAGWDGTTVSPAAFANPGVYGNNNGSVFVGDASDEVVAIGAASGTTTIAGDGVFVGNDGFYSQIGFHGAGGGDIVVRATEFIGLSAGSDSSAYAQIGNGTRNGDVTGNVTGNIDIAVGGDLGLFAGEGTSATNWIGNFTSGSAVESGSVSLVAGDVSYSGPAGSVGSMLLADLGTTAQAGSGGDVVFGVTDPQTDFINKYLAIGAIDYSSPHALTLLSTGDITLPYSIQNDGMGDLSILAGWDSSVAPANVLTTPGAYGNLVTENDFGDTIVVNANVWVVGAPNISLADTNPGSSGGYAVGASGTGTAIGSKGGITTIGAGQIYVEGLTGYAQIGYHADGGTGAINVIANGVPGHNGFAGISACFDGTANICVIGGRQGVTLPNGNTPYAQIGDLGLGVAGTASSAINVSATGNIAIAGGGIYDSTNQGVPTPDPGIANAYGQIGNGDASRAAVQTVSGAIVVQSGGKTNFASSSAAGSQAWLGNRTGAGGSQSGDVTLLADSLHGDGSALSAMFVEDLGTSQANGGNLTIGLSGTDPHGIGGLVYNSPHALTYLSAGDVVVQGSIKNAGTGDITLVAGWDGLTLDSAGLQEGDAFGNNAATLIIGGEDADGNVSVGSFGGTTTLASDNITLDAENGYAQVGFNGGGATGNINVLALGDVTLGAVNNFAQIGHGGAQTSGSNSGDISVSAGGNVNLTGGAGFGDYAQIGHGGVFSSGSNSGNIGVTALGDLTLTGGSGNNDYVQIGNGGGQSNEEPTVNVSQTGAITVRAADVSIDAGQNANPGSAFLSYAQIGNGGVDMGWAPAAPGLTETFGGDISVTATTGSIELRGGDFNSYAQIGNGGLASANQLENNTTVSISGDISVSAANGSVTVAGSDDAGVDFSYAQIGNGGAIAGGLNFDGDFSSLVVSESGNISITAQSLALSGGDNQISYAQVGNGGSFAYGNISGNISVVLTGDLTLTGGGESPSTDGNYVQIGNGSIFAGSSGAVTGNIGLNVGGTTTISSQSSESEAWIGNAAGTQSTNSGSQTGTESGSVQLITGDFNGDNDDNGDAGRFVQADLAGGPVTLGFTDKIADNKFGGLDYASPNALTILAAGNLEVLGDIRNSGTGAITIVGGWDGTTLDPAKFANAGVYGNNHSTLLVGGDDADGSLAVGSLGGTTTVLGGRIRVEADNGDAQIGYNGGGSGAIDVVALNDLSVSANGNYRVALIGNGSPLYHGAVGGDISVTAGGNITVAVNAPFAAANIGNIGGDGSSQSGNIGVTASGAISISADNYLGNAQIGNLEVDLTGTPTSLGDASGNITITSASLSLQASGPNVFSQVGNGNSLYYNNNVSGDISITTGDLSLYSAGQLNNGAISFARIGDRANGNANSNITINANGDVSLTAGANGNTIIGNGADFGSAYGNITLTATGDLDMESPGENAQTRIGDGGDLNAIGALTVQAGGDITLDASGQFSTAHITNFGTGTIGGNIAVTSTGGQVSLSADGDTSGAHIGNAGTDTGAIVSGNVGVTASGDPGTDSGSGAVLVVADGTNSHAQIGNGFGSYASATGNITVTAAGTLAVAGVADTGSFALIGNGAPIGGTTGNVSGNIAIAVGGTTFIGSSSPGNFGWIGNVANGGTESGSLQLITGDFDDSFDSNGDAAGFVLADLAGGPVTVGFTDPKAANQIGGLDYSSANALTILTAGNLTIADDIQNSGTGAITVVAGWDGTTLDPSKFTNAGVYGNNGGSIVLGGTAATGDVAVGSAGGSTNFYAQSVTLAGIDGTARLGYAGTATGAVDVFALGTVTLTGGADMAHFAQIGSGSVFGANAGAGDVNLTAAGMSATGFASVVADHLAMTATGGGIGSSSAAIQIAVNSLAAHSAGAGFYLTSPKAVSIAGVNLSGGSFSLVAGGAVTQTGALVAGSLNLSTSSGSIVLTNAGNMFGALTVSTQGSDNATVTDSTAVTLAASTVGGKLTVASGGAVTQSGALHSAGLNVSATSVALTNAANAISGVAQFATTGAATFYDTLGLSVGASSVGGDLTLLSKGDVAVVGVVQSNTGAVTVVAGWDGTTTTAAQFGNSGVYGNGGGSVTVGGAGASGNVAVGSNSGATTIYASNLNILGTNGGAQLGYHGAGGGAIKVVALNNVTLTAGAGNVLLGNGSLGSDVSGNVTGDIDVRPGCR